MHGCRMAGTALQFVLSDRDYWLQRMADVLGVIEMVTGCDSPTLIGWCGCEYAWIDCFGSVFRMFAPGHPGALA